jgi:hypothetical protein
MPSGLQTKPTYISGYFIAGWKKLRPIRVLAEPAIMFAEAIAGITSVRMSFISA